MNPADFPQLRRTVIWAAMSARTLDQCERADRLMREWLLLVGDDRGVRLYGAGLQRMHDALLRTADDTRNETDPTKRGLPGSRQPRRDTHGRC